MEQENIETTDVVTQDSDAPVTTGSAELASNETVTIAAQNPTQEEMTALMEKITEEHDFSVDVRPVNFNFKKSKDKDTGIETVRETVQLAVAYPSTQGIVDIISNAAEFPKPLELLKEAMETVINAAARDLLYEDLALAASTFPMNKISWNFIADLPKAQRRGGGIAKEIWEAFGDDYCQVMPDATGRSLEQCANAAKLLVAKLSSVRTAVPVLELMVELLTTYTNASPNIDDYKDCVEFLLQKADAYLNVSDEDLLKNL